MDLHLHPKQSKAFLSRATEILYGGAAGGGKSFFLRVAAIAWCVAIPGLQVYLFRRTYPELVRNHMTGPSSFPAMLSAWVKRKLVRINYSDNVITFWNGAQIHLCHCQYEKDKFAYHGAEIHVLLIDELTTFTATIYRYLRSRVRMTTIKLPAEYVGVFPRIVTGSNPGNIGHNWVKDMFVRGAAHDEIRLMGADEGGMLRQFIPAKIEDNPTLMREDPTYVDRLSGLGSADLVRAMLEGDWDIVAGGMLDDLWRREIQVIKSFAIPYSWPLDRSFDWGSSRPFAVIWWAESDGTTAPTGRTYPRGSLFAIYEWYGTTGRPNEGLKMLAVDVAEGIVEREREWGLDVWPGPADSSIYDTVNGVCIADDMEEKGVEWMRADKTPGSRKNGWERMRKYLKASLEQSSDEPGLYIFDRCPYWVDTVPVLPRDKNNPDDVDTNAEDHLGDCSRYRLLHPTPPAPPLAEAGGERESFGTEW